MNKYENINLEQSCPLNNLIMTELNENNKFIEKIKSEVDFNKCLYSKFRKKKNNMYSFNYFYGTIKENDIVTYDNIINRNIIENIYKHIYEYDWRIQTMVRYGKIQTRWFQTNVVNDIFFNKLFYDLIIPNINFGNKEKLKILRASINLHLPLHTGVWHIDGPGLGPTIVVYLNPYWKNDWDGQTAFYKNTKTKEIKYIDPVPGRIAMFHPYIRHTVCDISIHSIRNKTSRFTLAYHTYYQQ